MKNINVRIEQAKLDLMTAANQIAREQQLPIFIMEDIFASVYNHILLQSKSELLVNMSEGDEAHAEDNE